MANNFTNFVKCNSSYYTSLTTKGATTLYFVTDTHEFFLGNDSLNPVTAALLAAKQDALNSTQLNSVNSGITSLKVTTYDGYAASIATAQSTADSAVSGLSNKVDKDGDKVLSTNDYTTIDKNKLSGIETGAQVNDIETIKVDDVTLEITEKTVNIDLSGKLNVSDVVDNVTSTETNKALSANQGKELNSRIDALSSIGRFLALWDCTTGKPTTDPTTLPYNYHTGDYFIVSKVGTSDNKKPNGTQYTGEASTTVEAGKVSVNDYYTYDGTNWSLLVNTRIVDDVLDATSYNAVSNHIVTTNINSINTALNGKQNTLTAGTNITIEGNTISAAGTVYTAGTNVQINGNVISATDTTYGNATTSTAGLMSSTDKIKLDGVAAGAQVNVLEGVKINGVELTITDKKAIIDLSAYAKTQDLEDNQFFTISVAINALQARVTALENALTLKTLP